MSKYKVIPITLKEANQFVDKFHRHNKKSAGHKFSIGLKEEDELIGVAIGSRPVARLLDDGETLEIVRVCIIEGKKNACSMLYARMTKIAMLMGYDRVITYTLEREAQSSMKAIGAVIEKEHIQNTWNRPNRKRTEQEVFREPKIRWLLNPKRG